MSISLGDINKFGVNYNPISSFNQVLQNDFDNIGVDGANGSLDGFQNILNQQMDNSSAKSQNPHSAAMVGGVSMEGSFNNLNYDTSRNLENAYSTIAVSSASPVANTANGFENALGNGINSLNAKQVEAQTAVETLASGGNISVHDVMIASQKASLNMQMALQLRNKILNAYNELYQMRI